MKTFNRCLFTCFLFFITLCPPAQAFQTATELISLGDSLFRSEEDTAAKGKGEPNGTDQKRSINTAIQTLETYIISINHLNKILEREIDTTQVSYELPIIKERISALKKGLTQQSSDINLRYLSALKNLIGHQIKSIGNWKELFDNRSSDIYNAYDSLLKIKSDRLLSISFEEPQILPSFQEQMNTLEKRIQTADSLYFNRQLKLANFQSRLSYALIEAHDIEDQIKERESQLEKALFNKEINYLWQSNAYRSTKELFEVIERSFIVNKIILSGYGEINQTIHILTLSLALLFYLWFKYLLRHIKAEKEFADIILQRAKFIPKQPFLSALIIVLPFASFLYPSPPVVMIVSILWLMMIVTTALIRPVISNKVYLYWWIFLFMFVIYSMSNLYIETAYEERWPLLTLSVLSIGLAINIIKTIKKSEILHPRYIIFLIQLFIALQGASLLANITGRHSLAKILGIAATSSLMQAIGLYVFVMVIMEAIYLQIEMSKKSSTEYTAYFDFQDIQRNIRKIFIFLAMAIWLYYLSTNLSIYDYLYEHIGTFLSKERKIGQTPFTYGSVLVFIIIVWISTIISKYISFFAEAKDQKMAANRKQRLGSSILLIKLGIFTAGFLLAVTAAGIPLDNVAIVLGALSVGIGFGLQTIINNLVSGVILAFERPIQIGDAIEVGGRSGVVKEVGIRASKIQAYDGSEVILPNGDLLSQHLTNWTLSNKQRRIELIIGVAYGSDSDQVETVLTDILKREGIMKNPTPSVYLQNFADSAVEYRLLFWVNDFDTWVDMRNEVMKDIYKKFGKENIEIPFPQRDLYIKSIPKNWNANSPSENKDSSPDHNEEQDKN
ncbi:hypothetical protein GCM10028791_38140 [Echinicola sediminis]